MEPIAHVRITREIGVAICSGHHAVCSRIKSCYIWVAGASIMHAGGESGTKHQAMTLIACIHKHQQHVREYARNQQIQDKQGACCCPL